MRGTFTDTQVARSAMCLKMFLTDRSRRRYGCLAFITFHSGCSRSYILSLRHYFGSCGGSCQPGKQKAAFGSVSHLFLGFKGNGIAKCILATLTQTIKAIYATAVVNGLFRAIDT